MSPKGTDSGLAHQLHKGRSHDVSWMTLRDGNSGSNLPCLRLLLNSCSWLDEIPPVRRTISRPVSGIGILACRWINFAIQNWRQIWSEETGCDRSIFWPNLELSRAIFRSWQFVQNCFIFASNFRHSKRAEIPAQNGPIIIWVNRI